MSTYIDGFVLPLATDKLEEYRKQASLAGEIWKEHGALQYIEAVADDLFAKDLRSFTETAAARDGETVVVAFIVFASREHRDQVNARVMEDPRIQSICAGAMPFDPARMSYGGFRSIVDY